jgi:hypothetical protein
MELEAASCAAIQELPAFYGTRSFITVFTRALHSCYPEYLVFTIINFEQFSFLGMEILCGMTQGVLLNFSARQLGVDIVKSLLAHNVKR